MNYLNNVETNINEICEECNHRGTEKCNLRNCNIGFAKYVIQYAKKSSIPVLEDGINLIPKEDMSYYDQDIVADSIVNICKLCKECSENHNENCIVSLIRRSLESTQLSDNVVYPGNVLMYIMNVAKQNPKFAEEIKERYMA